MLDETQRREIGRQPTQFCRNCPAIEDRAWGENVMRSTGRLGETRPTD